MNSKQDTLTNDEKILKEISDLRYEMNGKFRQVDERLEEMRLQMVSFDVRTDRIKALIHKSLSVSYNARADWKEKHILEQRMSQNYS